MKRTDDGAASARCSSDRRASDVGKVSRRVVTTIDAHHGQTRFDRHGREAAGCRARARLSTRHNFLGRKTVGRSSGDADRPVGAREQLTAVTPRARESPAVNASALKDPVQTRANTISSQRRHPGYRAPGGAAATRSADLGRALSGFLGRGPQRDRQRDRQRRPTSRPKDAAG